MGFPLSEEASFVAPGRPWWSRQLELIVVILLGIVSVATAYTSFQSSLYGGRSDDKISQSQGAATSAESLYLEGNQQFVLDAQTVQQLALLQVGIDAGDPLAQAQYDQLFFIAVSEDLEAAMANAAELDEADPGFWHDPQSDEEYLSALFGGYVEESERADTLRAEGDALGLKGDTLGLYTALLAITLFLLGIAAVVRRPLVQWVLIGTGGAIFLVTLVLTAMIPFVWL